VPPIDLDEIEEFGSTSPVQQNQGAALDLPKIDAQEEEKSEHHIEEEKKEEGENVGYKEKKESAVCGDNDNKYLQVTVVITKKFPLA